MEYTIIYSLNFVDFVYDVQQHIDEGWVPLGPPIINISEYREWLEDNKKVFRHSQWFYHQAFTREKPKPVRRWMF